MNTRGIRPATLVTVLLLVLGISAALTRMWVNGGHIPSPVPTFALVLVVVLGSVVLWFGWSVRAYQRGSRPHVDMLRAARTLALAQAAALTGAALIGFYVGQSLGMLPDWDLRAYQRVLWRLLLGAAAGGWLVVAGLVVQNWCRIPPRLDPPAGADGP